MKNQAILVATLLASLSSAHAFQAQTLLGLASEVKSTLNSPHFTAKNCSTVFDEIFNEVSQLDPRRYSRVDKRENAFAAIQEFWLAQLAVSHKIQEFYRADQYSEACSLSARNALRALRGIQDYLGYTTVVGEQIKAPITNTLELVRFPSTTKTNPKFKHIILKSGDLLLSRGNAYSSATISRIAKTDTQFSHVAVYYLDEKTNTPYVIQAHIEIGVVVDRFADYFRDGKVRASVFRYEDEALAKKAAEKLYKIVKDRMNTGQNIEYNFSMDQDDYNRLFCSQVVRYGFKLASNNQVTIPYFDSSFEMKNPDILNRLGVTAKRSFVPADLEVDPRFTHLAEWTDYQTVHQAWTYDAMLTEMFRWMEDYGYRLDTPIKQNVITRISYNLRRTPFTSDLLDEKFPLNMKQKTLETIMVLDAVAEKIEKRLALDQKRFIATYGTYPTFTQLTEMLEAIRRHDLPRGEVFHKAFHP
jgi:hypothetical protein